MKLEVGMYVRTETGQIGKITNFDGAMARVDTGKFITYKDFNNEILKASHNIIDLIEVGDYVNGGFVVLKQNNYIMVSFSEYEEAQELHNKNIKSIVTREQFESMSYKVGG